MSENSMRNRRIIHLHLMIVNSVVPRNIRFVIGDMLEHVFSKGISKSPHILLSSFEKLIHLHVPSLVQLHTSPLQFQNIRIRPSPSRNQQSFTRKLPKATINTTSCLQSLYTFLFRDFHSLIVSKY